MASALSHDSLGVVTGAAFSPSWIRVPGPVPNWCLLTLPLPLPKAHRGPGLSRRPHWDPGCKAGMDKPLSMVAAGQCQQARTWEGTWNQNGNGAKIVASLEGPPWAVGGGGGGCSAWCQATGTAGQSALKWVELGLGESECVMCVRVSMYEWAGVGARVGAQARDSRTDPGFHGKSRTGSWSGLPPAWPVWSAGWWGSLSVSPRT